MPGSGTGRRARTVDGRSDQRSIVDWLGQVHTFAPHLAGAVQTHHQAGVRIADRKDRQ